MRRKIQACFFALSCSGLLVAYADDVVYELPQVVAAASPIELVTEDAVRGTEQTLEQTAIRTRGVTTLTQLLSTLDNVVVRSGTAANPEILIRGVPALMLLNGEPMSQFSMQDPDLDLIALDDVQSITIEPSSAGVLYGNEAIGGVINIVTRVPTRSKALLLLGLGNPWQVQTAGIVQKHWDSGLFAKASTQWLRDQGYRAHSKRSQMNGSATFGKSYATGEWWLTWRAVKQDVQFPGYLTQSQIGQPKDSFASQGQGVFDANINSAQLHWRQSLSPLWVLTSDADYRQQWGTFDYSGFAYDQDYRTLDWHPSLKGQVALGRHPLDITLGYRMANEQYQFTDSVMGGQRNQFAWYGLLSREILPKLTLDAGDRFLHAATHAQFVNGSMVAPQTGNTQNINVYSVGLNYQLLANWNWYLRRDGAYQLPYVDQQAVTTGPASAFGLQPETSIAYELGSQWSQQAWSLAAQAYWIQLKNEIMYDPTAGVFGANVNLPPTERQGFLAYVDYQPLAVLNLHMGMNWMRNRFTENALSGNTVPGLPNWLVDWQTKYQISTHWSSLLEVDYRGQSFAVGDDANVGPKVPDYWLFNLAFNYVQEDWQFSVRLENLTNQRYYSFVSYSQSVPQNLAYYPANGRTLWVSLQYQVGL